MIHDDNDIYNINNIPSGNLPDYDIQNKNLNNLNMNIIPEENESLKKLNVISSKAMKLMILMYSLEIQMI